MMRSPCGHDAFAVLAQRVLHVSAAARRGAAAYADGCEQIFGHSHLISQSPGLRGGDLRAGFYTTFCVRHNGTIPSAPLTCQSPLIATPPFWTDFGTIMTVGYMT